MNKTTTLIIALAVAAASFWAGTYYQSRQFMAARFFGAGTMGGAGRGGFQGVGPGQMQRFGQGGARPPGFDSQAPGSGPRGARVISGRLDRLENGKLTLTTAFGSVKVILDKNAKIKRTQKAVSTDLKVGNQVLIQGVTTDREGQMTAKSVIGE